jgi:RHS repeat-associated protein
VTRIDRPSTPPASGGTGAGTPRFTEYTYDDGDRVTQVTYSDGGSEKFAYRADGAMTAAIGAGVAVTFEHDAVGRVVREARNTHWVESEFDSLGWRVRVRSSMGADQKIQRNSVGDVVAVTDAPSGYGTKFTRDRLGSELERTMPGGLRSRWQRDKLGRPIQHDIGSTTDSLRAYSYSWEPDDRLKMLVDSMRGASEFGYDALGTLAWAKYNDGTFELRVPDAVGNLFKARDQMDRQYGPVGQLLAANTARGRITYHYDVEGNLVEKVEPSGRRWGYEWNVAGMLVKVVRPDGSEVEFGYDALGRRVTKRYRGQTTHVLWDGDKVLHEWVEGTLEPAVDFAGVPTWNADAEGKRRDAELLQHLSQGPPVRGTAAEPITWLFDPEGFAPIAKLFGGGQHSIVSDQAGAPRLMVDGRGRVVFAASVSAYGELRELEGDRFQCPWRWQNQYEDAETGLYYNRFRYYDPEAGIYVSQDPIGLEGGLRGYAYVADPLTQTDPFGLKTCGQRQQAMLDKNAGYNISAESWFKQYSHLGRWGTFVTDKKAFRDVLGHARPGKYTVGRKAGKGRISAHQARQLEKKLGLEPGSLREGFPITRVENIRDMSPRSPLEGNRFFRGPGKGLPGGGPEIVVDPIPTS